MLSGIFKSNHPSVIFIVIFFGALLWLHSFIDPGYAVDIAFAFKMPLYYLYTAYLAKSMAVSVIMAFVLLLLQAFWLNQLNKKYILLPNQSYMPALFLVLLVGSYMPLHFSHPAILGAFFLVIAVDNLFKTYREHGQWLRFFDASLLISLASLFYIKMVYFILLIWIAMLVLRPFRGREWLVSLIGFATPYFFVLTYFYVFEHNLTYKFNLFLDYLFSQVNFPILPNYYIIYFAFVALLLIVASLQMLRVFNTRKVRIRRYFMVFFWMFFITVVLFGLQQIRFEAFLVLAAVPLSYLFSNYFSFTSSRTWSEIFLFLFLGLIAFVQVFYTFYLG